ncbi:MAG TPA: flagellar export protein FliJ [Gammaproteobacteria bacterium]|nr:flagellar export protein FliJ [Gammaproteobacteria bacterium]
MKRPDKLAPVVRLAREKEKTAALELALAQRDVARERQRGQELSAYLGNYQRDLDRGLKNGIRAADMLTRRAFLERLRRALAGQQERIRASDQRCEERRQAWLRCRRDAEAAEKLWRRRQQDERRAEERREQNRLDDYAGQRGGMMR